MNFELRALRLFNDAWRQDYVRMIFLCESCGGVLAALNELFYHVATDIFWKNRSLSFAIKFLISKFCLTR